MYRFLIGTVTPKDSVQGGIPVVPKLLSPAVGDSNVQDQWFRLFAYAAPFYAESDPQLSREMMWTWHHGGSVVQDTGAHPCTLLALLYPKPELPQSAPDLASVHYAHIGYVIFRQHFGAWGQENFAIFETSPLTYHAHHDEGHFSIWADATPLTLDSGTGGYYNGDRCWYLSGRAHNVVQFEDELGALQDGPLRSHCEDIHFSEGLDYVPSEIPDIHAESYHRHFAYVKAGFDVYVVWDQIHSQRNSVWNLHTLSTSSDVKGNVITSHCLNGKQLETTFLEPLQLCAMVEHGGVAGEYPLAVQEHFQISGNPGSDYLTLLYPKSAESQELTVQTLPVSPLVPGLRMYRVTKDEHNSFLLLVNGSEHKQIFSIVSDVPLLELRSEKSYPLDTYGRCHVEVDADRLTILVHACS
ncbi:Heparinase II/III-like protein [compost metagenome]